MRFKRAGVCVEKHDMEVVQGYVSTANRIDTERDGLTALVVDDDRHVRSYLRMLLRGLRVTTVAEAGDIGEGLGYYQKLRPSIVLLDVDLPGFSVAEAMQQLRSMDPDVAVIAVTACTEASFGDSLGKHSVLGWIPIYVVREEVAQKISSALDRLRTNAAIPTR